MTLPKVKCYPSASSDDDAFVLWCGGASAPCLACGGFLPCGDPFMFSWQCGHLLGPEIASARVWRHEDSHSLASREKRHVKRAPPICN